MTQPARSAFARSRLRIPIILASVAGWIVFISVLYLRVAHGGTTKGAGELLQIGALPVT